MQGAVTVALQTLMRVNLRTNAPLIDPEEAAPEPEAPEAGRLHPWNSPVACPIDTRRVPYRHCCVPA